MGYAATGATGERAVSLIPSLISATSTRVHLATLGTHRLGKRAGDTLASSKLASSAYVIRRDGATLR